MPDHEIHALAGVGSRVRELASKSARLTALRDRLGSELQSKKDEVQELDGLIERLAKVGELFRLLLDQMVDKQVRAVEDIVTEGLQTIFHDQVLSFEAEVGHKYNRTHIEFYIREGSKADPLSHRGRPLEAFGGGPSCIAGLTLRTLAVLRLKLWPFLALDEALGAVSPEYVEHTGRFLNSLAEKMGIDILIITQVREYAEYANIAYRCSQAINEDDGTRRLTVARV